MEEQIQTHPVNKMGPNPNEMCLWTNPVQVFVSIKSTKYVEASSWTTLVEETGVSWKKTCWFVMICCTNHDDKICKESAQGLNNCIA